MGYTDLGVRNKVPISLISALGVKSLISDGETRVWTKSQSPKHTFGTFWHRDLRAKQHAECAAGDL